MFKNSVLHLSQVIWETPVKNQYWINWDKILKMKVLAQRQFLKGRGTISRKIDALFDSVSHHPPSPIPNWKPSPPVFTCRHTMLTNHWIQFLATAPEHLQWLRELYLTFEYTQCEGREWIIGWEIIQDHMDYLRYFVAAMSSSRNYVVLQSLHTCMCYHFSLFVWSIYMLTYHPMKLTMFTCMFTPMFNPNLHSA